MKQTLLCFYLLGLCVLAVAHPAIPVVPAGTNIAEFNSRNDTVLNQRNTQSQNTIGSNLNQNAIQNVGSHQAWVLQNNMLINNAKQNAAAGALVFQSPTSTQGVLPAIAPSPISQFDSLVLPKSYESSITGLIFIKPLPIPALTASELGF